MQCARTDEWHKQRNGNSKNKSKENAQNKEKNTVIERKNASGGLIDSLNLAEERIS